MMLSKAFPFMMLIGMVLCAVAEYNNTIDVFGDNSTIGLFNEVQDYGEDTTEEIIGGDELTPAERNKRPYLVTVWSGNTDGTENLCGGSLISPSAVLTAAHCLFNNLGVVSTTIRVEFNRWALTDTSGFVTIPITQGSAVPHADYDPGTMDIDAAILFLDTPVNSIKPVILNTDQNVPASTGVPLDVAGWGHTSNDGKRGNILKATTLGYVTTYDCTRPPFWFVSEVTYIACDVSL